MNKYQFLEDRKSSPIILSYGQLGACQLLRNRQTNQLCILKLAPKQQALKQIQCLTQAHHPNIIKIVDYLNHEENTLIIFELLQGGDLFTKIRCQEIKTRHIGPIFKGICQGIQYIHSRKVIHRNLKTQTILLDQHFNPKIVDFGLAARIGARRTFCGCCYYMAPEILNGNAYDYNVDIWALGVILYEMVYGDVPFTGQNPAEVMNSIKSSSLFSGEAEVGSFDQLIRMILVQNPKKRAQIDKILSHPKLKNQQALNLLMGVQRVGKGKVNSHRVDRIVEQRKGKKVMDEKQDFQGRGRKQASLQQNSICGMLRNKISLFWESNPQNNPHYNYIAPH